MPQFDFSTWSAQLVWLCISFFLMFGMMTFFVVPNFRAIFSGREERVKNLKKDIETLQKKDEDERRIYQSFVKQAENEAAELLQKNYREIQTEQKNTLFQSERDLHKRFMHYEEDLKNRERAVTDDFSRKAGDVARQFIKKFNKV